MNNEHNTTAAQFDRIRRALRTIHEDANFIESCLDDVDTANSLRIAEQTICALLFDLELEAQEEVDEDVYLVEVK